MKLTLKELEVLRKLMAEKVAWYLMNGREDGGYDLVGGILNKVIRELEKQRDLS